MRTFAVFSLAAIFLTVLSTPLVALFPGAFVVGGHFYVGPGQTLDEDVSFFFAQVTIDEGASVDGHIFMFSSALDLGGNVTNGIRGLESDLTLRESAQVAGAVDETDLVHWTLLLPAINQIP